MERPGAVNVPNHPHLLLAAPRCVQRGAPNLSSPPGPRSVAPHASPTRDGTSPCRDGHGGDRGSFPCLGRRSAGRYMKRGPRSLSSVAAAPCSGRCGVVVGARPGGGRSLPLFNVPVPLSPHLSIPHTPPPGVPAGYRHCRCHRCHGAGWGDAGGNGAWGVRRLSAAGGTLARRPRSSAQHHASAAGRAPRWRHAPSSAMPGGGCLPDGAAGGARCGPSGGPQG